MLRTLAFLSYVVVSGLSAVPRNLVPNIGG